MAATQTVPQLPQPHNFASITPRCGVVTLFGYGIKAYVERGHLMLEDGIGAARRRVRLPRVRHGLRRLVVIGSDGFVSLAAIRWLADQSAAFVMLERDGSVLATTGPVSPTDARLRRAQSWARQSGIALEITKDLIRQKLAAQAELIQTKLTNPYAAELIVKLADRIEFAKTQDQIRILESQAAAAYWSTWRDLPIVFPQKDLTRVPDHWQTFGSRISPLTGSPRLAVNPPNAMLNYLYALLESESSLAVSALGLDPGIGIMHADRPNRDSLACDVMEPIRPRVDAFVLDWIRRGPLRREWFFEERNGNARLMAALASRLSESISSWRSHVAPIAESVVNWFWTSAQEHKATTHRSTRLTQSHRRAAEGSSFHPQRTRLLPRVTVCRNCGKEIKPNDKFCLDCVPEVSRDNLIKAAHAGRIATVSDAAQSKRAETQRRQSAALKAWNPSDKPEWLDEKAYREKIQPQLKFVTVPVILKYLGVSEPYATNIRAGRCIPHPRHWAKLLNVVNKSADCRANSQA